MSTIVYLGSYANQYHTPDSFPEPVIQRHINPRPPSQEYDLVLARRYDGSPGRDSSAEGPARPMSRSKSLRELDDEVGFLGSPLIRDRSSSPGGARHRST